MAQPCISDYRPGDEKLPGSPSYDDDELLDAFADLRHMAQRADAAYRDNREATADGWLQDAALLIADIRDQLDTRRRLS